MYRGALGVVLYFCRLAGVAPFLRGDEFRVSSFLVICAKLFITITAVSFVIYATTSSLYHQTTSVFSFETLKWVSKMLVIMVAFVSVFTSSKRTLRLMRLLKELDKIDKQIAGDRIKNGSEWILTLLILIYLHVSLVIRFYDFLLNVQPVRRVTYISLHILVLIAYYMANLSEVLLVLFAKRISASLKLINHCLDTVYKSLSTKDILQIKLIKNHPLPAWNNKFNKVQSVMVRAKPKPDTTLAEKIQEPVKFIRQCIANYVQVCDIISTSTAGDSILNAIIIMCYILHLLAPIYELVLYITSPDTHSPDHNVFAIYWLITYTVTLVFFVEPIHRTYLEMQKLQLLLTSIMLKNLDKENINNELLLFWRIVNLNKPSYSPLGMFNLNRSLILKIFGSLVTYLVIIVTYGSESKDNSSTG